MTNNWGGARRDERQDKNTHQEQKTKLNDVEIAFQWLVFWNAQKSVFLEKYNLDVCIRMEHKRERAAKLNNGCHSKVGGLRRKEREIQKEDKHTEIEQVCSVVRNKRKGLSTSARHFVAHNESMAGVIPRQGDVPSHQEA